jgi:SH3-like domain-containing protein
MLFLICEKSLGHEVIQECETWRNITDETDDADDEIDNFKFESIQQ